MPLPFNKTLDLKLIQLVKENPIIYDTKHPKHLDFDTREVTWQKIGDALCRSAVEFAGIQCQIHYGDFQEEKHKPGLIENLNEYLPAQYSGSWGVEKKILKEFRRHQGLSSIEAKYLYTKTARAMPTYGVTFFLVKEQQKGKKKLVPRLLGINAESILRLDEVTKEILQVWPLTQVKTYHAGKSETFTLNFGDYSDKEYSVKTNDAYRIRDILLGYIDIIRKRMEAKFNQNLTEHHVISEDNIHVSKGNVMEHIKHGPGKIIQETFVGPSKIISYEPGQAMTHGTQVVTVQQMIVTGKGEQQRQVMTGQVPMRHQLEVATKMRKLNNLNSYAVKIVTLLTDPTESNLAEAKNIVDTLEAEMPSVVETVQEAASKQSNEDARKNLLNQLEELCDCTKKLSHCVSVDVNPEEASEAAKRIADLSTMMYFSIDPTTKKRSEFCRRSRQSFVQDEEVSAGPRRASATAATLHACQTLDRAGLQLYQEYEHVSGRPLQAPALERSAARRLDQLSAAVALYLTAFADPKNIDYSTAVTSMNTINEVIPKLVTDAKALGSIKDDKSRQELLDQIKALCDATKAFCQASDPDDHQKMQDAASGFSEVSGKLMFTLRRGKHAEKHNEIIDLARDAGNKAGILLVKTNELTALVPDEPDATQLDDAGVRCADAARDLVTCAALTASSIHEPHCQSALTVAAETLSSSAQSLAATWKPLVEEPSRKPFEKDLKDHTLELAKALDKLKAAYAGYDEGANDPKQAERLKFHVTVGGAKKIINDAKHQLDQPTTTAPQDITGEVLRASLSARMDELNAALAALIAAAADPDNPDYAAAEQASNIISELIPEIARDGRFLGAASDPNSREQLMRELKALCDATDSIYKDLEDRNMGALNSSASKFANSSGKLAFMFNPHGKQEKENQIVQLSSSACSKSSELTARARRLAALADDADVDVNDDGDVDVNGDVDAAADAVDRCAGALAAAARVSGQSMHEAGCQRSCLRSADALAAAADRLAECWAAGAAGTAQAVGTAEAGGTAGARDPRLQQLHQELDRQKALLDHDLASLRAACFEAELAAGGPSTENNPKAQRLNFIRSAAEAQRQLLIAEKELGKPAIAPKQKTSTEELRKKLSESVGQLNASLAALVNAIADHKNPDYAAADEAMRNINQLLPQVVKDGKALGATSEEEPALRLRRQLNDLCQVTRDIYNCCEKGLLKDLNGLASKFANSSGELSNMSNPEGKQDIEHKILQLSTSASRRAGELVGVVEQLGVADADLEAAAGRVASTASALATTAQLTAPCIQEPRCQQSLEKSANTLSSATRHLASAWQPLVVDPPRQALGQTLDGQRLLLDQDLDRLRQACREASAAVPLEGTENPLEVQRLQFVKSALETQRQVDAAEKELEKPVVAPKHKSPPEGLRSKLYDNIARLNAAVAALVAAMADRENPDYGAANEAMNNINQLLPQVVKETKSLSALSGDESRAAMLSDLRHLCDVTRALGAALGGDAPEDLNNAAAKFAAVSGRMVYVFNPRANQDTEHRILDLSSSACEKASELLAEVYQQAAEAGGGEGASLDRAGADVADAANALLTTAQLSAPCMQDPQCRSALVRSVEVLGGGVARLAGWEPELQRRGCGPRADRLGLRRQALDQALQRLREACQLDDSVRSPVRRAPPPPSPAPAPAPASSGLTQAFLDTLRREESNDRAPKVPAKVVDVHNKRGSAEEKALQQKFVVVVDEAVGHIRKAEDNLIKVYNVDHEIIPTLSVDETLVLQKQIEQKIALACAAAAKLVAANHLEGLDYGLATQSTQALAEVMPLVMQDAKMLRGALDDKEREAFLADLLSLFDATKVLIGSAKNDPKKMNDSAVAFSSRSAKLLYTVRTDVDPAQEDDVLARARGVGDGAARLAALGAGRDHPALVHGLCTCADTAGTLVYTAKLVAPAIQHPQCQEVLIKTIDDLSDHLQSNSTTWEALPEVQELREETDKLQEMLGALRTDLEKGALIKRRLVEKVVVEDTPLRQLACSVFEDAKRRAEQSSTPLELKHKLVKYVNELGRALQRLDAAYHASVQAPHDAKRRCKLENAIQNLQVSVLQGRPSQEDRPQNNIVDLTDYVREVSDEAHRLREGCGHEPELVMVREHCDRIKDCANRVMNPGLYDAETPEDSDDIMEVEHFSQETEKRVRTINSIVDGLNEGKPKIEIQEKAARLTEASNILRFASKSALATTQSVALDATLEELSDLEKKIDEMILAGAKQKAKNKQCTSWLESGRGRIVSSCSRAASGLAPAFTAYVCDVTAGQPADRQPSCREHLSRLLRLLQARAAADSRHLATWQPARTARPAGGPLTQQILKELDDFEAESCPSDASHQSALTGIDLNRLLQPTNTKVQVEHRQLPEKLNQAASKLSTTSATIMQSVHKPESLARSLNAAVEAATHLAAVAASVPPQDASHSQRIEDATKEMALQTYNVLKTADSVTQDPQNYAARRKLLDACQLLNEAINVLVRASVPAPGERLQRECGELWRALQLQQALAAAGAPGAQLGYGQSLDALHNQLELIERLTPEEAMPREQFCRSLSHVSGALGRGLQYGGHCGYLLSISDQNKDVATRGFIDVSRIQGLSQSVQESCHRIIRTEEDQAKAEAPVLIKQVQDYQQSIVEAQERITDSEAKVNLKVNCSELDDAMKALNAVIHDPVQNRVNITSSSMRVLDATKAISSIVESQSTAPEPTDVSPEAKARSEDVMKHCRNLNNKMLSLLREVKSAEDQDPMTWVTFGVSRKALLDIFQALLVSVRENGKRAGILEPSQEELEEELNQVKKSYVQIQLDLCNKWLGRPTAKADVKAAGEEAARAIITLGEKTCEDLNGDEKEEMQHLVTQTRALLEENLKTYDSVRARLLMERLKALKKAIERSVVNRVVEDFLEGEEPLADLEILTDAEKDESKRKFLLERKIAELLAHLGRVNKTARLVAGAAGGPVLAGQLLETSQQTELLAPMLVKAAQQRVNSPEDQAAIEHYQKLLAQYVEAIANVRDLCDQAVDPMDFVQTAGETIQRMREETSNENDPQKRAYASSAITKLANRVINVGMSSNDVRKDPELQKALKEAKERLKAVVPKPNARPSRIPDWQVTTAEILRTTGEVESVLGGEMIFKKQQTTDQPIFAAALDLHTAVRGWSARDNDIVAVAKRMAVLMAKLSDYMNTDRKRDLIATAKAIVSESHEVADLARNLAHECTDVRIKTNLLQVCERIPTISGQLKMLATVKGSSLGHQGSKEDLEDMNTLVGNAQNLMTSVQEVVKAAASASVKIMSERGGRRVRWVRNTYY